MAAFEVSDFTADELVRLIAAAKRALYPEAVIVGGELECVSCHIRGTPALIEDGMIVTHDLRELSDKNILARGWDGSSSDVSEEGELLLLECSHCFQWHRIPESVELQWL